MRDGLKHRNDLAGAVFHFLTQSHKSMKRWAILTVLLYALALLLLTVPIILLAFGNWGVHNDNQTFKETMQVIAAWQYWLWLGLLMAGQVVLLLVPISLAEKRLPARRKLKVPVIVAGFFLANLFVAGVFSVICAIFLDDSAWVFSFTDWLLGHRTGGQASQVDVSGWGMLISALITIAVFWVIWGFVFNRFAKSDEPDALLKRITRWLLRGSILELLVAVPSHIIVRRRDDCCAPIGTFWGIVTGISVMLLCFGPGVFFLFAERFGRLQAKLPDESRPV